MSSLISYDSENRIRILDPALFAQLEGIVNESSSFTSKIGSFKSAVAALVDVLQKQAKLIEHHKLLAIGLRNKVESETDARVKKERDLQSLLSHRKAELERYTTHQQSLEKVEQNQRNLVDKLSKPQ
ncbi:unnamed protein product (mitochondrion) [Plasmodiophora brassicae]|uniref:Uncharacterized protein n=1 Tax=Plasmodiophora brassicae TaxID=37360 RepID=A0A0G4IYQ6_PLABS|nr:hypothetical protein PBRA_007973 [Plasmodiophora brassicae]SPQ96506.1 unnamed protein product [Plasmodiophora brassicae]